MFEFRGLPRPCANPVGLTFLGNKTSTAARLLVPFTKASGLMWIALCGRKTQIWALGKRSFITRDSCSRYVNAGVIDRHSGIFAELFTHLTSLLFQLRSSTCRVKLQTHVQNDPRSGFSEGINNYHLFFFTTKSQKYFKLTSAFVGLISDGSSKPKRKTCNKQLGNSHKISYLA